MAYFKNTFCKPREVLIIEISKWQRPEKHEGWCNNASHCDGVMEASVDAKDDNNNNHDNVYDAVIMT